MPRSVAEVNKSPLWSTRKQLALIPIRFETGASAPANVVAPGTITVSRTSATVYVITMPQVREASSTAAPSAFASFSGRLAAAQYIQSAVFAAVSTNGTSTITVTFSGAPADGTQVRGVIVTNMASVA